MWSVLLLGLAHRAPSRRTALAATGAAAAAAALTVAPHGRLLPHAARAATTRPFSDAQSKLEWAPRSGLPRAPDASSAGGTQNAYPPLFVTYLTRFLLNFDSGSQQWWADQIATLPLTTSREALVSLRSSHFAAYTQSVNGGLQQFGGDGGPRQLYSLLRSRYGVSKQARLQLAILFSLIDPPRQPSACVRQALGEADNATVARIEVLSGGERYTYPPVLAISPPDAQSFGRPARALPVMRYDGQAAAVRLDDSGAGYLETPIVTVSPPRAIGGRAAVVSARVASGRVIALSLVDAGSGYSSSDSVVLTVDPPRDESGNSLTEARAAEGVVLLSQCVESIEIVDGGYGYAQDQPVSVTAVVNSEQRGNNAMGGVMPRPAIAKVSLYTRLDASSQGEGAALSPGLAVAGSQSVSSELLALLPSTSRPRRGANGYFTLQLPSRTSRGLLDTAMATVFGRDPVFGPLGTSPVQREVALGPRDYFSFAFSGAVCTATVRTALVPIELSKTLMQAEPAEWDGLGPTLRRLWGEGGLPALYTGVDVVAAYGALLGGVSFGANEFLRRYLSALAGAAQPIYVFQIQALATLGAVLASCLVIAPLEVLRIRTVVELSRRLGSSSSAPAAAEGDDMGIAAAMEWNLATGLVQLAGEGGLAKLYSALGPLIIRELPFTVAKFFVFDATTSAIESVLPSLSENPSTAFLASLIGGLVAGAVAGAVSTPADTVLTRLQRRSPQRAHGAESGDTGHANDSDATAAGMGSLGDELLREPGSLFSGWVARSVLFGAIISGQYLLYDVWKRVFKVSPNDIVLVLDVFADRLSFYE